jgi:acyl carrier protein
MSDTAKRVRKVLAAKFDMNEADLVPEASIVSDLGADSLDVVEISMALEKEFDIEISDEDIESTKTLRDLERLIDEKT